MIGHKPGNNDIIQLFYCILLMVGSLKKFDNCCNKLKKGFTTFGIIQPMKFIVIIYTPSLFDLLKTIGMTFNINLCGFNIGC